MLNRVPWTVLSSLTLAGLLAGCLEPETVAAYQAYGSQGSYTTGFAYTGKGIVPFDGPVYLDVNEQDNTGRLIARGKIGPSPFEVVFDTFAPSRPFHDGGIASNLIEHGDSGVGDTSIPRVDLEMAGWGKATIQYNGRNYDDPIAGNDTWTAHFMVIRNGVRDNATGAIYADANRTKPYNATRPAEGVSSPGDYELHLVLRNGTSRFQNARGTGGGVGSGPGVAQPNVDEDRTLFESRELASIAQVTFTVSDTAVRGSNLTFTVRAPSGQVILAETLGEAATSPGSGTQTRARTFTTQELGEYRVGITGRLNPGGSYEAKYVLSPPAAVVFNLWWEDVVFGVQAQDRAVAERLVPEPVEATSS